MSSKKGEQGHESLKPYDGLHKPVSAYDDGACLGRHEGYYKINSCSYRWQAVKRATGEDKAIYDSHPDPTKRLSGTAHRNPTSSTADKYHSGGALVGAPGAATTTKSGKNKGKKHKHVVAHAFRTGFSPYINQAHHLLPDAELRGAVFDVTKAAPKAQDLIFQDLLTDKYNLNHWKNMMILPSARTHGQALGLPTHPCGHNHITYSRKIRIKVKKVFKPYQSAIDDEKNGVPHAQPDSQKVKSSIEAISEGLHALIVSKRSVVKLSNTKYEQMDDFHTLVSSSRSM